MKSISIKCPGKVNLFLEVTGKREDGYHLIDSLFLPIDDISDTLLISKTEKPGISISCSHPGVPCNSSNLIWKAAESFAKATNIEPAWHFELEKNIPVAGGMGGGSSNAASTFMALNELNGSPLSKNKMQELALNIGADLPFFFEMAPAIIEGIGERIESVKVSQELYLLFMPFNFPVPAAWTYKNRSLDFSKSSRTSRQYLTELNQGSNPESFNDLAEPVFKKFPITYLACKEATKLGAYTVNISGSGPTCFALFDSPSTRDEARRQINRHSLSADYLPRN